MPLDNQNPTPPPKPSPLPLLTLIILILFSLSLLFLTYLIYQKPQVLTPLGDTAKIIELNQKAHLKPQKIVYGFLPYWNYKYYQDIPYHLLSHLALFGANVQADGSFQTREKNYTEPGWRALNSSTTRTIRRFTYASNTKLILTLRSFDDDITKDLISSPSATQNLIQQSINFLQTNHFDGINLDFEPVDKTSPATRDLFTQFVASYSAGLKAADPNYHLGIDVYAESAKTPRLWDLPQLSKHLDHIIIMAYDFHLPSSKTAGPVAPLYGADTHWSEDITSLLTQHLDLNPSHQIILGVPFYGYEWRTNTQEPTSPTLPRTGVLATYSRVHDLLTHNATISAQWDNTSLSPWIHYQRPDVDYHNLIHYDDAQSLGYKFDLVNQTNLAGIAIWALGYEVPYQEPWQVIQQKFPSQK